MANYRRVIVTDDVLRALTETVKLLQSEDTDWLLEHHVSMIAEWLEALEADEDA